MPLSYGVKAAVSWKGFMKHGREEKFKRGLRQRRCIEREPC